MCLIKTNQGVGAGVVCSLNFASTYVMYSPARKVSRKSTEILVANIYPWTEEPGGLQSMGSQAVGPD